MSSNDFELLLMDTILVCVAILFLLFIFRLIKILVTKKIEGKEDAAIVFFLLVFIIGGAFLYYLLKKRKGEENTEKEVESIKKPTLMK